ncbi:MAG TPA: hypothetical protein DCY25_13375 [Bacteroidales bacterium]|nr:hypothetical protein [Bacteroidales bacterium]
MSQKKSILLRIDPRTVKAIEKWAADEFRSTNGQIEYLLEQALRKAGRYKGKRDDVGEQAEGEPKD